MLDVRNLTKKFVTGTINEVVALADLNLHLEEGDFLTVIGSNGAGKTTFLNLIAGTYEPTSGEIFIDQKNVTGVPEHKRAVDIGRVFQEPGQGTAPGLTVAQNLSLAVKKGMKGLHYAVTSDRRKMFQTELAELGLGLEDRLDERVRHLSGGQRQGLAVLMATLTMPKVLLLDEHTASLDPKNARKILEITERLVTDKELTTIMVTHDMNQALDVGNRLAMLHRGSILCSLSEEEKHEFTIDSLLELFSRQEVVDDELLLSLKKS